MIRKWMPALLLGFAPFVAAGEMKQGQVGIASYATVLSYDFAADDDFSGLAIFGTGAFNDNFALRGLVGFQSHDDLPGLDATVFEGSLLAGTGLATTGFKIYGSLGFYSEKWEYYGFSESFSGLSIGGGLGYHWNPVSLDFWVNMRSTGDYEDALGVSVSAASGGLGLSFRF